MTPKERQHRIFILLAKGLTCTAIAKEVGCSANWVSKVLLKHGVKRASQSLRPPPAPPSPVYCWKWLAKHADDLCSEWVSEKQCLVWNCVIDNYTRYQGRTPLEAVRNAIKGEKET